MNYYYVHKICRTMLLLYVFCRTLVACDVELGLDPEPIEANIHISLDMGGELDECDMRFVAFALWVNSGVDEVYLCDGMPEGACVYGESDECGLAVEHNAVEYIGINPGYCIWPVVRGCEFKVTE